MQSLVKFEVQEKMTLDQCVLAWLNAKAERTKSKNTQQNYNNVMTDFRSLLQSYGKDLDSSVDIIAPIAQGWSSGNITASTHNTRLAIISSFYEYAIKNGVLFINPIKRVERWKDTRPNKAHAMSAEHIKKSLASIDRITLEGKRDYILLSIALTTGRRVAEMANLHYGHIQMQGNVAVILWERCKGNKEKQDALSPKLTQSLFEYLHEVYGQELYKAPKNAPIWISTSNHNKGEALSTRSLQRICEKRLGTSKFHATRHSCAKNMNDKGISVKDIQEQLGHANLAVTSLYLQDVNNMTGKHIAQLEELFGI